MGLDMYLSKRKYVKNWDHDKDNKWQITVKHNGKVVKDDMPIKEIVYEAGYWRKANQIHKWFTDNCNNGDDDNGQEYYVSPDQLKTLYETCLEVIKGSELVEGKVKNGERYNPDTGKFEPQFEDGKLIKDPSVANLLLPTESGFFFGSTEYDQWYLRDIEETVDILEKCLADTSGDYYYRSSW